MGIFLRSVYPKEDRMPFVEMRHLTTANREFINKHRYFQSHVGNLLYPFLDRDIPTITFLRDPFERSVSWLRYMAVNRQASKIIRLLFSWRLELYKQRYSPMVHRCLDLSHAATFQPDFQTRMLGLTPSKKFIAKDRLDWASWIGEQIRRTREVGMDDVLAAAKKRLDSMAVVGTVEQFDESIGLVCDFLGVPKPETPPVERVAPGRSIQSSYRNDPTVPPALARIVERNIQYDIEIHRYATQLLRTRLGRQAPESAGKAA